LPPIQLQEMILLKTRIRKGVRFIFSFSMTGLLY
jgi:hypothetical protein